MQRIGTTRGSVGAKALAILMSIVLVLGLNPGLTTQRAYADDQLVAADVSTLGEGDTFSIAEYDTLTSFTITTQADLTAFKAAVDDGKDFASKTVAIAEDAAATFALSGPIGDVSAGKYFAGNFNGGGHTITLNIETDASRVALFSGVVPGSGQKSTIENVVVAGKVSTSKERAAGVVAVVGGDVDFVNVGNTATVSVDGANYAGGLVAYIASGSVTFDGCFNRGAVSALNSAGGFVGYNGTSDSTFSFANCYDQRDFSGGTKAGGFVGDLDAANLTLSHCYQVGAGQYAPVFVGNQSAAQAGTVSASDSYYTSGSYLIGWSTSVPGISNVSAETLKGYASTLGTAFAQDATNINGGYPVLAWEVDGSAENPDPDPDEGSPYSLSLSMTDPANESIAWNVTAGRDSVTVIGDSVTYTINGETPTSPNDGSMKYTLVYRAKSAGSDAEWAELASHTADRNPYGSPANKFKAPQWSAYYWGAIDIPSDFIAGEYDVKVLAEWAIDEKTVKAESFTWSMTVAAPSKILSLTIENNQSRTPNTTMSALAGAEVVLSPRISAERGDSAVVESDAQAIALQWYRKAPGGNYEKVGESFHGDWWFGRLSTTDNSYNYTVQESTAGVYAYQLRGTWEVEGYTGASAQGPEYTITYTDPVDSDIHTVMSANGYIAIKNAASDGTVISKASTGDTVYVFPTANEGYRLKSVKVTTGSAEGEAVAVEESGSAYKFTMPAEAVWVSATFDQAYVITASVKEGGTLTPDAEASVAGKEMWVKVSPDAGWKLKEVTATTESGDSVEITQYSATYCYFTMPAAPVIVTAEFEHPAWSISVSEKTVEHGSITLDKTTFHEGDTVKVTATTDERYVLSDLLFSDGDGERITISKWNSGIEYDIASDGKSAEISFKVSGSYSYGYSSYENRDLVVEPVFDKEKTWLLTGAENLEHGTVTFVGGDGKESSSLDVTATGGTFTAKVTPGIGYEIADVVLKNSAGTELDSSNFDISIKEADDAPGCYVIEYDAQYKGDYWPEKVYVTPTFKLVKNEMSLTDGIAVAEELLEKDIVVAENAADVPDGMNYVTDADRRALKGAIDKAKGVAVNDEASGAEASVAETELEIAIAAYKEAAEKVGTKVEEPSDPDPEPKADDAPTVSDKAALTSAIAKAQAAEEGVAAVNDGTEVEPSDTWVTPAEQKALDDAIKAAQAIADDANATATQVKQAASDVNAATAAYEKAKKAGTKPADFERVWGDIALDTMSKIIDEGDFAVGGTVVLTTADGFWDALTATGIAGMSEAPVMMTSGSALSDQTAKQLARLKPTTLIVCGGPAAVSQGTVDAAVAAAGNPKLVWAYGDTAVDTASEVFLAVGKHGIGEWSDSAFICTTETFHDSMSAASIAYAKHMPIFLASEGQSLSDATLAAMKGKIKHAYIVGGEAAISPYVEKQLTDAGIAVERRLWGDTAIETSVKVAEFGLDSGLNASKMGVATGASYYDALAGAALCGKNNAVLVLVNDPNSATITDFIASHKAGIGGAYVFGGTAAVGEDVAAALEKAVAK